MNVIQFECPMCKQSLDAPEELANELIECPACKHTIEVPIRSRQVMAGIPESPETKLASLPTGPPVLPEPPTQVPRRPSVGIGLLGCCLGVVLGLLASGVVGSLFSIPVSSTSNETGVESSRSSTPVVHLRLGKWSWRRSSDEHVTSEGEVTNVSGDSLKNVEVVVTFRTKSGGFITSASALSTYNPILPNQTSPWKVIAHWNPEIYNASVAFKTLFGPSLRVDKGK